jgi:geranylgeranyl diphosphate synthase type II
MLKEFLAALDETVAQTEYGQQPVELYEPIRYLMNLGGKRMRPLLTVLAAQLYTDDWRRVLRPAIAVEVFHNFTLMHDDIMDRAPLRRGQPTVHAKWNENVAILSGDVMLVCAYELLLDVPGHNLKVVLQKFNRAAAEVCEGQQWDMNFETRADVTKAGYLAMIRLKTAVLLGFALELGGILGGADAESCVLLQEIGTAIGTGFQLKDDLLDVYGDPGTFGKQAGGDIRSNKKTFLLLDAVEKADGTALAELNDWLAATDFDAAEKVARVTAIYDALGVRQAAEAEMNGYFQRGLAALDALAVEESRKQVLRDFVVNLISRER